MPNADLLNHCGLGSIELRIVGCAFADLGGKIAILAYALANLEATECAGTALSRTMLTPSQAMSSSFIPDCVDARPMKVDGAEALA